MKGFSLKLHVQGIDKGFVVVRCSTKDIGMRDMVLYVLPKICMFKITIL